MPSSMIRNGFHVLGLPNSAEMKEILRRSNEIAQFLELDEFSEFGTDIVPASSFRTADAARDALRRLQNPRLRFEDYFFWLDFKTLGPRADAALKAGGWWGLTTWLKTQGPHTFAQQREFLVSQTIALKTNSSDAPQVFGAWKGLFDNAALWDELKETYRFDGQLAASDELISTFRSGIAESLGDIVLEMSSGNASSPLVRQFAEVFGAKSDSLKDALLSPALEELKEKCQALARIRVDEGIQITPLVLGEIRDAMRGVEKALNDLIDAGLYETSEAKLARDNTALEMRRLVLDCHNHHNEFAVAHGLLTIARSVAGTDALRNQLSNELEQVGGAVDNESKNTFLVEVPGTFGGGIVIFKNDTVAYNGVSIRFRDASSISYSSMARSLNFIPYSQSYSVAMISTTGQSIDVNFGTTLYIGNTAKQETWAKLAGVFDKVAGPHIVERMTKKLFEENAEINIGGVTFNSRGYSKKRTFGGTDTVLWSGDTYLPKLNAGNVIVWTAKDGKATQLTAIPMSTPNAVILPELVRACVEKALGNG
jgi:hypothetical protein